MITVCVKIAALCFHRLLIKDKAQILCKIKAVPSFLGVYPSDILPPSITRSANLIVNTDPHTASGTHLLAIHLQPRTYTGYFSDSYGLPTLIPSIATFMRRMCSVWEYNTTSKVCGQYCCLFVIYIHRGYSPRQFVGLFDPATADRLISRLFASEFGALRTKRRGGHCCTASIKGNYTKSASPLSSCHSSDTHCGSSCRFWAALRNTKWDSREGTVYRRAQCSRDFSVS